MNALQHFGYLIALLGTILCLHLADWRWRLAWWHDARATGLTLLAAIGFFGLWDIAGVILHIFATNQAYVSGVNLWTGDLPLEELCFLIVLCYITLLGYRYLERRRQSC